MPSNPLNIDLATVSGFPATLELSHADSPTDFYPVLWRNTRARKVNYLRWAQLEFHFCTVLMMQRKDGTFHQLQNFYWNVRWTNTFDLETGTDSMPARIVQRLAGATNTMNFGKFNVGDVTDWRFASLITSPYALTCNTVADQEEKAKVVVEKQQW